MMNVITHPVAAALFEAHVEHTLELLGGDFLAAHLSAEVDAGLVHAAQLTLGEVVTRDLIKATVHTYAVDMPMAGGIPELVGDIARALHAHPMHDSTRLADLISDHQVRDIIAKAVEMREVREQAIERVLGNPILSDMAADLIYRGIKGYLAQSNDAAKAIPGAGTLMSLGKSVLSKASPGLEKSLDEGLLNYVQKSTRATLLSSKNALLKRLSDEAIERAALDFWGEIKHQPASVLRDYVSAESLEEWFVIGYEYWRSELRHTPTYSAVINVGIDCFFDKYEGATLAHLLEEVGVTRDMILREALRFAPPVIAVLRERGVLEDMVRRQLLPFYASGRLEHVLAAHGVQ